MLALKYSVKQVINPQSIKKLSKNDVLEFTDSKNNHFTFIKNGSSWKFVEGMVGNDGKIIK